MTLLEFSKEAPSLVTGDLESDYVNRQKCRNNKVETKKQPAYLLFKKVDVV